MALTRVFSVLFRAPYVFLVISAAIGGLGLGGLLLQFLRPSAGRVARWIVGLAIAFAFAVAAPILLLFANPLGREQVATAETAVVAAVPLLTFTVAGMLLSLILRQFAPSAGTLYFIDLGAAAAAAPATVLLLDLFGGINTPLFLAALGALAGAAIAWRAQRRSTHLRWVPPGVAVLALAALLGVLVSNLALRWIDLPPLKMPPGAYGNPEHPWYRTTKPLFAELADPYAPPEIVRTDWTALARTDVARDTRNDVYYVYTDSDVPTQMEPWDGTLESARREYSQFIGSLPYFLMRGPPARVLAIGPGGGLDVLLALCASAREVDAVEINPSIPAVIRDPRFRHTYARVYERPGVRLTVDEGRSFLQRAGRYDLIYFACAKTATTQTSGVALLDNHLYTVEAFQDYWRHLADDGMVALVTQEAFLIDRLLLTALEALRREGIPRAGAPAHLLTAGVALANFTTGPYRHILLLRRRPWRADQIPAVEERIRLAGLEPLYLPFVKPEGAEGGRFDPSGPDAAIRAAIEAQYPVSGHGARARANLAPVTDDNPFYADVAPGVHPTLRSLLLAAGIGTLAIMVLVAGYGLRLLGARASIPGARASLLGARASLLGARASLPGARASRPHPVESPAANSLLGARASRPRSDVASADQAPRLLASVLYFALLGAGFMFVELALMQKTLLLLGFPTRALTVTLFALLLSSAWGSFLSQRGSPGDAGARLGLALVALPALLVVYRFLLPPVLGWLLPFPLWVRVASTVAILVPPGILMGMPFPTALRCMSEGLRQLVPAFWSVNGAASILGSVATMAMAKFAGYSGALLVGAAAYAVAWVTWLVMGARGRDRGCR